MVLGSIFKKFAMVFGISLLLVEARADSHLLSNSFAKLRSATLCSVRLKTAENLTVCLTAHQWRRVINKVLAPTFSPAFGLALGQSYSSVELKGEFVQKMFLTKKNSEHDEKKIIEYLELREFETVGVAVPSASIFSGFVSWVSLRFVVERLRLDLAEKWKNSDSSGVMRSLFLADSSAMGPWPRVMGFIHIQTTSGMHLYSLEMFWLMFLTFLSRRGVAIRPLFRFAIYPVWIGLWLLQGMRWGLLRPLFVLVLKRGLRCIGIETRLFSSLILALMIEMIAAVLLVDSGLGRWHYALAVGGGMVAREWAVKNKKSEHLAMALGSWLWVLPLDLFDLGFSSLLTPVWSFLSIPLILFGILPEGVLQIILSMMRIESSVLGLDGLLAAALNASFLIPQIAFVNFWIFMFCFLCLGVARVLLISQRSVMAVLLTLAICGRISIAHFTAENVTQLDVGQGDAALVQESGKTVSLIDVGPPTGLREFDWFRILGQRHISNIDEVALTHLDADHAGGFASLDSVVPVAKVCASESAWRTPGGKNLRSLLHDRGVRAGTVDFGCSHFDYFLSQLKTRTNIGMVAYRVKLSRNLSYLNFGDASSEEELSLLGWNLIQNRPIEEKLILKISHHGSRFSTSSKWLSTLQPSEVWISVGLNTYGHPALPTLELAQKMNLRRTDQLGAISIK